MCTFEKEKAQAIETLIGTKSEAAKKGIEQKIDDLEKEILNTQEQRNDVEVTEYDIKAFINHAKFLMEHLDKLLLNTENMQTQEALFGLVFDEFPTYFEILNGTPKLSLIFKLFEEVGTEKSLMAPTNGRS